MFQKRDEDLSSFQGFKWIIWNKRLSLRYLKFKYRSINVNILLNSTHLGQMVVNSRNCFLYVIRTAYKFYSYKMHLFAKCLLQFGKGRPGFRRWCYKGKKNEAGDPGLSRCVRPACHLSQWCLTRMPKGQKQPWWTSACSWQWLLCLRWWGTAFPLVQVKYNALPALGISVFNPLLCVSTFCCCN